ncbi:hypothetical protein [Frankia sp. Cppng1_Ct_nod]|nr:hypothetical protein [Frankia sp. Cppng1_Ct_nod]
MPTASYEVDRCYLDRILVLETTFTTQMGSVTLTDGVVRRTGKHRAQVR